MKKLMLMTTKIQWKEDKEQAFYRKDNGAQYEMVLSDDRSL